jgi:hypothetical protein
VTFFAATGITSGVSANIASILCTQQLWRERIRPMLDEKFGL